MDVRSLSHCAPDGSRGGSLSLPWLHSITRVQSSGTAVLFPAETEAAPMCGLSHHPSALLRALPPGQVDAAQAALTPHLQDPLSPPSARRAAQPLPRGCGVDTSRMHSKN